jgi:hypothetical protein|tara:strand:+ start:1025 stop:1222 length:198 start_codon:yes stop_codon:yes gene_type:complete
MATKSNSLLRRYAKLNELHGEIMQKPKNNIGQCVHSLQAFKKYIKTFRQIVLVENGDAIFKHTQL